MCGNCGFVPVIHTMREWLNLPDEVSKKGVWYVVSDYRTDNDVDVARFKFGDGKTLISKLPFVTAAITDNDMESWDDSVGGNDFGKTIIINDDRGSYTFPTDGYLMLEFEDAAQTAEVRIYGASGKSYFTFSKRQGVDVRSKEVFVRKGMKCAFIGSTDRAAVKFVPLV